MYNIEVYLTYRHFGFSRVYKGNSIHRISPAAKEAWNNHCERWREAYELEMSQYLYQQGILIPLPPGDGEHSIKVRLLLGSIMGPGSPPIRIIINNWQKGDFDIPDDARVVLDACWAADKAFWEKWDKHPALPFEWRREDQGFTKRSRRR